VFNLRCLKRHLPTAWDLFADLIQNPRLDSADLDVVRQQMLLEIRQALDSPDGALGELARRHVYAGHPYAANPRGTEASVRELDAARLRAHIGRFFTRRNSLLVVSGDLEASAVQELVAAFAPLPAGDGATPLPPRLRYASGALQIETRELPTDYILGEFAAPALRDAEHPAMLVASRCCATLLRGSPHQAQPELCAVRQPRQRCRTRPIYVTAVDPAATLAVMRTEMGSLREEPIGWAPGQGADVRHRYALQNETNHAQAYFSPPTSCGWRLETRRRPSRARSRDPGTVQEVAATTLHAIQYTFPGDPQRADPGVSSIPDPAASIPRCRAARPNSVRPKTSALRASRRSWSGSENSARRFDWCRRASRRAGRRRPGLPERRRQRHRVEVVECHALEARRGFGAR
jgi:zinc protease